MNILRAIGNSLHSTGQAVGRVVVRTKELRNDPDFFQKAAQVAFSSLELAIFNKPGMAYLSKFCFVLKTANMHDFYRVIQQPRKWLFPVDADSINEKKVLKKLYVYVENYITQTAGPLQQGDDILLRDFLKECMTDQLTQMNSCGDAYRNFGEFKEVLQKRMQKPTLLNTFNLSQIDLNALDVPKWLRHTPLLERVLNSNWAIVDIGCFGLFFQEWGLWEPAKLAATIGKIPLFQWVKNQSLEKWVVGLVVSAFALKFVESARKLTDDKLTPEGRTQARWNMVTSFSESVLYGAIYSNIMGKTRINNVFLLCFAIVAKSLGLLSIALRPKREFFQ